jgi:hypothetical protein
MNSLRMRDFAPLEPYSRPCSLILHSSHAKGCKLESWDARWVTETEAHARTTVATRAFYSVYVTTTDTSPGTLS